MEHTGRYYETVANVLHNFGLFVSTVNPLLIKEYGRNSGTTKRGSPYLRKTLFNIMKCHLQNAPENEPVCQFIDKKHSECSHTLYI